MSCAILWVWTLAGLAKQALELSFYVMACHNDRQLLNNYFEPCYIMVDMWCLNQMKKI